MKNHTAKSIIVSFVLASLFVTVPNHAKAIEASASDTDLKLVYNCSDDINEAFEGVYDQNADSDYWAAEALNVKEFLSAGQGTALADENGVLPSASAFDNKFSDTALSLKTYPLFTNKNMYESGSRYFNQYPTGWKMTANGNPSSVEAWPSGYCSANTTYLKFYFNGSLHPGDGAAVAVYFKAPYTGKISVQDTISVSSSQSDGVYLCVYTVPAIETKNYSWNSVGMHALYGGYPVYPTEHVSPSANWTDGWLHISPASPQNVAIDDFSINQGDYLVFIYASGASNGYDLTASNPIVTYDESSVLGGKLEQEKEMGVVKVKEYVDLNDYREAERSIVESIIADATVKIEACTTLEDIDAEVAAARALIDQVKTDKQYIQEELSDAKTAAIDLLANFVKQEDYRDAQKAVIQAILDEAANSINDALSEIEINTCVELAKVKLLSVKTNAQLNAEELDDYKRQAMDEIENLVDLSSYDENQKIAVEKAQETYKEKIYKATTIEEATQAFNEGKAYIEALPKTNVQTKTANVLTVVFGVFAGLGLVSLVTVILLDLKKRRAKK